MVSIYWDVFYTGAGDHRKKAQLHDTSCDKQRIASSNSKKPRLFLLYKKEPMTLK